MPPEWDLLKANMPTTIVNIRRDACEVYCGRRKGTNKHYGNPFSHLADIPTTVQVQNREEACNRFESWIREETDHDVESIRRLWILANLKNLRGKVLGCFCKPLRCHCETYLALLNEEADEANANNTHYRKTVNGRA